MENTVIKPTITGVTAATAQLVTDFRGMSSTATDIRDLALEMMADVEEAIQIEDGEVVLKTANSIYDKEERMKRFWKWVDRMIRKHHVCRKHTASYSIETGERAGVKCQTKIEYRCSICKKDVN